MNKYNTVKNMLESCCYYLLLHLHFQGYILRLINTKPFKSKPKE